MTAALIRRRLFYVPLLAAGSALFGALVAIWPELAVALVVLAAVTALAFAAPVTHLTLLVFLTTIVPYSISNRYSGGGAGLLASDVFLLTGLARAVIVLPGVPLDRRRLTAMGVLVAFSAFAVFAAWHGYSSGRDVSDVGAELRTLLGFTTALIAITVLLEREAQDRLMKALAVLGLTLGLWGIAQWVLSLNFVTEGDFGVRQGVSFTSGGRGQVQGGLFAFPVAILIASAALMSGCIRSGTGRAAAIAVVALNAISLLLTFERTFWVATVFGLGILLLRAGRVRRLRALIWLALIAVVGFMALSTLSPGTMQTARERLLSIGQYRTDESLRERRVESEHVIDRIEEAPFLGSGLAAEVFFGKPWQQVPPHTERYTHNGYLYLVWRLGLIGAGLLFALLLAVSLWRGPPPGPRLFAAVRSGSQASLLALLVANVTFPVVNGYGITATLGLLIGISALPRATARTAASRADRYPSTAQAPA
jgi:O-antigen ligase